MICENCGAEINNRESYCPNCGMELLIPYSKSLKEKYLAGEYNENHSNPTHYQKNKVEKDVKNEIELYTEKNVQEPVQNYETRTEDYPEEQYEEESGVSLVVVIILFLIVALLIGFVIGILVFSGFLHSLPGFSKI